MKGKTLTNSGKGVEEGNHTLILGTTTTFSSGKEKC